MFPDLENTLKYQLLAISALWIFPLLLRSREACHALSIDRKMLPAYLQASGLFIRPLWNAQGAERVQNRF